MNNEIQKTLIAVIEDAGNDPRIAETWIDLGGALYDRGRIDEARDQEP